MTPQPLLRLRKGGKLDSLPPIERGPVIGKSRAHRLGLVIPETPGIPPLAGLPRDETLILTKVGAPRVEGWIQILRKVQHPLGIARGDELFEGPIQVGARGGRILG